MSPPLTHPRKHPPALSHSHSHHHTLPRIRALQHADSKDEPTLIVRPHADISIALSTPTLAAVDTSSVHALHAALKQLAHLGRRADAEGDTPARGTLTESNIGAVGTDEPHSTFRGAAAADVRVYASEGARHGCSELAYLRGDADKFGVLPPRHKTATSLRSARARNACAGTTSMPHTRQRRRSPAPVVCPVRVSPIPAPAHCPDTRLQHRGPLQVRPDQSSGRYWLFTTTNIPRHSVAAKPMIEHADLPNHLSGDLISDGGQC
ncbi:hypothetical protein FIBSPDRAFT_858901, partial [Athelia psychrophila]